MVLFINILTPNSLVDIVRGTRSMGVSHEYIGVELIQVLYILFTMTGMILLWLK